VKWKPVSCLILLACIMLLQTAPVMATSGTSKVSGSIPLAVRDIFVPKVGYHSATISWKTNGDATSQVFYDTSSHDSTGDYRHHTDENIILAEEHSVSG
jgi:hypothetical protein